MPTWLEIVIGIVVAMLVCWLLLVTVLWTVKPSGHLLKEALRLLPDLVRLLRRLAADNTLPRGVRIRLGLLMVYLAIPIDLIPDFIPVLGYADDAIILTLVLRSVVRRAGLDAVHRHWPGTPDGFTALTRLTGLQHQQAPSDHTDVHCADNQATSASDRGRTSSQPDFDA
ncbi:YkvA family protein [Actinopolymorpha pittospori]